MRHKENVGLNYNTTTYGLGVGCYGFACFVGIIGFIFSVATDSPSYLAGYILLGCTLPLVWLGLKFHGNL